MRCGYCLVVLGVMSPICFLTIYFLSKGIETPFEGVEWKLVGIRFELTFLTDWGIVNV